MNRLSGKAAVITGGALGIGRAIATRMAQEGAMVTVLDTLLDEGRSTADELDGLAVSIFLPCCKRRSNNPSLKRPDNLVAPE